MGNAEDLMHQLARTRHERRVAAGMNAYAARGRPEGERRSVCPLSALAAWIRNRRRPQAFVASSLPR